MQKDSDEKKKQQAEEFCQRFGVGIIQ